MLRPALGLLAMCSCASDQDLVTKTPGVTHDDTADTGPSTTTSPPIEEECNGEDDDGDGLVDEDFVDADQNGVVDCLEPCASVAAAVATPVEATPECVAWDGDVVKDPWNVRVLWETSTEDVATGEPRAGAVVPLVAPGPQGDGARIVTLAWDYSRDGDHGLLATFSERGEVVRESDGWAWAAGMAGADVDGDGVIEWVGKRVDLALSSFHSEGTVVWSVPSAVTERLESPIIVDFWGDGGPEVVEQGQVFDAADGSLLFHAGDPDAFTQFQVVAGDLDLDGVQELVFGSGVYDASGNELWGSPDLVTWWPVYPLLVQADIDPEGEVAYLVNDDERWTFLVYDTDGSPMYSALRSGGNGTSGPPCSADLDLDGRMDVVLPQQYGLTALSLDGTVLWTAEAWDESTAAGCSVSDLDGDGRVEVLYAGEEWFAIHDGATGAVLFRDDDHASSTGSEYPVIVDLDVDGHAEILLVGGTGLVPGEPMLRAYTHAGDGWTPGGTSWLSANYSMADVNDDGTIPRTPEPSWTRYGIFRGRLASLDSHPPGRDLKVEILEVCVTDCAATPAVVSLQVANAGTLDVPAGAWLTLYAVDRENARVVYTVALDALPAGTAAAGILVELDPSDIGELGLRAEVDDDGTGASAVYECREDNNADTWEGSPCP